jgi:asparagine synthase (glutamine-hydrolysing)
MCGICGAIARGPDVESRVQAMMDVLEHRGPDASGLFRGDGVFLGHRRLKIIDLSRGAQPMSNEDESVWIIFNGEIYNYRELRPPLEERGHRFKTDSDTEVIIHLYEEHGEECVKLLRGMFAFAIWDGPRRRLFAARDRLGQKPFYYAQRGGELWFASEIKGLLAAHPDLADMDLEALDQYLTLRLIAPPRSMFRGIRKLPPAHTLTYDEAGLRIGRYWRLEYEPKAALTEAQAVEELEERLIECLRLHLISDVPVGAFMSGGLDSTLLVALIMKHRLADDFQTFSVGLPYQDYDEAPYARLVAVRYGTRHHEEVIRPSLVRTLPRLVWHLDEPSDSLAVCQYLISGIARRHVKVVIGGEGGDELFGGYDRYYGNIYAGHYSRVPAAIRRWAVEPALLRLADGKWYKSKAHQLKWLHRLSFHQGGDRYAKSLSYFYFAEALRRRLYGPRLGDHLSRADPEAEIRSHYETAIASRPLDRMLNADSNIRLPDHPVMILDRMTMAHGLEARAPFMDHDLAEFAARLPVNLKVRGRRTRHIQRLLAERYLPAELLRRPKQGFQSALPYMLRDEYTFLTRLFLGNSELVKEGFLDGSVVSELVRSHLGGEADHGNRLWLLINSEVWYRMYIQRRSVEDLGEEILAASGHELMA